MNKSYVRFGAMSLVCLLSCGAYALEPVEPEPKQEKVERKVTITKGKVATPPIQRTQTLNPDAAAVGRLGAEGGPDRVVSKDDYMSPVEVSKAESGGDTVFTEVEQAAEFPGGTSELSRWLGANLRYPEAARKAGVQGRVVVSFIVEKDGSISSPKVLRGVSPELDAEALRMLGTMPRWTPGKRDGEAVRSSFALPITFHINE